MHAGIQAFVDAAVEAYRLRAPAYRIQCHSRRDRGSPASLQVGRLESVAVDLHPESQSTELGLPFPDGTARTVLCTGALQEIGDLPQLMAELQRLVRPGGAILLGASLPKGAPERIPACWHLTPLAMERLLWGLDGTMVGWQGSDDLPHTVYGLGFNPPLLASFGQQTQDFLQRFQSRLDHLARQVGRWPRLRHFLGAWSVCPWQRQRYRLFHRAQFAVSLCAEPSPSDGAGLEHLGNEVSGRRLDLWQ